MRYLSHTCFHLFPLSTDLLEGFCETCVLCARNRFAREYMRPRRDGPQTGPEAPDGMTVQPSQEPAQEPLEPLIEGSRGPTYNGGGCPCSTCSWLLKAYAIGHPCPSRDSFGTNHLFVGSLPAWRVGSWDIIGYCYRCANFVHCHSSLACVPL